MPLHLPQTPTIRNSSFSDESVFTFSLERNERRTKAPVLGLPEHSDATMPSEPRGGRDSLDYSSLRKDLSDHQRRSIMGMVEFLSTTPPPWDEMKEIATPAKSMKTAKLSHINREILSQKQKLSRLIQSPTKRDTEVTSPFSSSFTWSPRSRSSASSRRQSFTSSNLSSTPSSPKFTLRFPFLKLRKLKHATSEPGLSDRIQTPNITRSSSSAQSNHSPIGLGISYIDFAHQSEALSFITSALDTSPAHPARFTNNSTVKGVFDGSQNESAIPPYAKRSSRPAKGPRRSAIKTTNLSPTPRQRRPVSRILPGARSSTFCRALTDIAFSEPITSADLQFSDSIQAHQELLWSYDRFLDDAPRPRQNSGSTESSGWNTPGPLTSDYEFSDDEDVWNTWKQSTIVKKIKTVTRFRDGRITREGSKSRLGRSTRSPRKVVFLESPSSSLGTVVEQPETYAKALENEIISLRTTLGLAPCASPYTGPKHLAHPNHPFVWNYQNLRCVRCPSPASISEQDSTLHSRPSQSGANSSPATNFKRSVLITCALCEARCCGYSALLSLANPPSTSSSPPSTPQRTPPITGTSRTMTHRKPLPPSTPPRISYAISTTVPNSPATSTFPTDIHAHHTLDRLRALPRRVCDGHSTFLRCASEACGRIVCSGCCGRCEEEVCGSVICVACRYSKGGGGGEEASGDGEGVGVPGIECLEKEKEKEEVSTGLLQGGWRCTWHE